MTDIHSYSINLMWINKAPHASNCTLGNREATFFEAAGKWATANPEADVVLWFDSQCTQAEKIEETREKLKIYCQSKGYTNIRLSDIREIPVVKENPVVFSDCLPIYFRVDLLKLIIMIHSIEHDKADATIFSDLEVGECRTEKDRMNKMELFDEKTIMPKLEKSGGLLITGHHVRGEIGMENQFLQLVNNERMIDSIKHTIINVNLMRAITALNDTSPQESASCLGGPIMKSTLSDVFNYALMKKMEVRVDKEGYPDPDGEWVPYNPKIHGYEPFGLHVSYMEDAIFQRKNCTDDDFSQALPSSILRFLDASNQKLEIPPETKTRDLTHEVRPGNDHIPSPSSLARPKETLHQCVLMPVKALLDIIDYRKEMTKMRGQSEPHQKNEP